jgi:hypothetical protein
MAIEPPPIKGSRYSEITLGYHTERVLMAFDLPPG